MKYFLYTYTNQTSFRLKTHVHNDVLNEEQMMDKILKEARNGTEIIILNAIELSDEARQKWENCLEKANRGLEESDDHDEEDEGQAMTQSVLRSTEDFKWLKDVHNVEAKGGNFVIMNGNEDAPNEIIVHETYLIDSNAVTYVQNALGKYVVKESLKPKEWRRLFLEAYLEACAWSSHDSDEDGNTWNESLQAFKFCDAAKEYAEKICNEFIDANTDDLKDMDPGQGGHDLWLTSAGHGCGFWDRGLGERGQRLTKASKLYVDDAYLGEDGLIHLNSEGK